MKYRKTITALVLVIAAASVICTTAGIFTHEGPGRYEYESIRGKTVIIYGEGIYRDMTADVAVQGIAQDYVTIILAIPLLLYSLFSARKGSLRGRFLLAGTAGYFFITYLLYTLMAMYNFLFPVYLILLGSSFFTLFLAISSFDFSSIKKHFDNKTPVKTAGGFLIFTSSIISLMWLGVILPPLFDGSIIPEEAEHYTTLVVQGLDLALLLPSAFVSAVLLLRGKGPSYIYTTVYLIFLSILMTALTAKIIAMGLSGVNIIPAVFIIPLINTAAVICTSLLIKNVTQREG
ncbi:MAG: hypothetical protein H7A26_00090 [Spirochaetales bacterium]|nr:hypothetical protein [Spirochaetales bacterium]